MTPNRLHPLALVMMLGSRLTTWAPLIALSFLRDLKGGLTRTELWTGLGLAGIILALVTLSALVRYWRFTYVLGATDLTVNSGLFNRRTVHIPYAKIQTLQRQQWFFLTPFALERLSVETSGQASGKPEAVLDAVPTQVAAQIEARRDAAAAGVVSDGVLPAATEPAMPVADGATSAPPAGTPGVPEADATLAPETVVAGPPLAVPDAQYTADAHALNLYALTSLGVIPIFTGLLWLFNKLQDIAPKAWVDALGATLSHLALTLMIGLVLLVLMLGLALSYFNLIQKYYHFTLTRRGDLLTAERGLFKRDTVSVRRTRIQAVRAKASLLRQLLHLSTVQGLTASSAADDESDNDLVLMPVVQDAALLTTMRPFIDWLPDQLPPLSRPRTPWRYARNAVLTWAGLGLGALLGSWWWARAWVPVVAGVAVGLTLVAVPLGLLAARSTGVAILDRDRLTCEVGGWVTRQTFFLRRANIQTLTQAQPVWLRRAGLGHLTINLRKGNGLEALELRYLDAATLAAVAAWFEPSQPH